MFQQLLNCFFQRNNLARGCKSLQHCSNINVLWVHLGGNSTYMLHELLGRTFGLVLKFILCISSYDPNNYRLINTINTSCKWICSVTVHHKHEYCIQVRLIDNYVVSRPMPAGIGSSLHKVNGSMEVITFISQPQLYFVLVLIGKYQHGDMLYQDGEHGQHKPQLVSIQLISASLQTL